MILRTAGIKEPISIFSSRLAPIKADVTSRFPAVSASILSRPGNPKAGFFRLFLGRSLLTPPASRSPTRTSRSFFGLRQRFGGFRFGVGGIRRNDEFGVNLRRAQLTNQLTDFAQV